MLLESNPEHLKIWNDVQDNFLLMLLDTTLNCLPSSEKDLGDMDENEFNQWLPKQDFSKPKANNYEVVVPELDIVLNSNCQKSETLILPLSWKIMPPLQELQQF